MCIRDSVYTCQYCEYSEDRDIHAADNMVFFGLLEYDIPMERRELTPVLIGQDTILNQLECVHYEYTERILDLHEPVVTQGIVSSKKQETNSSSVSW